MLGDEPGDVDWQEGVEDVDEMLGTVVEEGQSEEVAGADEADLRPGKSSFVCSLHVCYRPGRVCACCVRVLE